MLFTMEFKRIILFNHKEILLKETKYLIRDVYHPSGVRSYIHDSESGMTPCKSTLVTAY